MKFLRSIHDFDLVTFDWCLKRKHREHLISLSRWVSKTADGGLYVLLGIITAVTSNWYLFKVLAVSFAVERGIYFVAKNQFRRNRPQQAIPGYESVIQPSDQFSFPSGHTSAAFLVTGVLGTVYPPLMLPLLLWAASVGISRVMLGVHFPTDTLAGALMGLTISQLILLLV